MRTVGRSLKRGLGSKNRTVAAGVRGAGVEVIEVVEGETVEVVATGAEAAAVALHEAESIEDDPYRAGEAADAADGERHTHACTRRTDLPP